jgi:hypothetical protein
LFSQCVVVVVVSSSDVEVVVMVVAASVVSMAVWIQFPTMELAVSFSFSSALSFVVVAFLLWRGCPVESDVTVVTRKNAERERDAIMNIATATTVTTVPLVARRSCCCDVLCLFRCCAIVVSKVAIVIFCIDCYWIFSICVFHIHRLCAGDDGI